MTTASHFRAPGERSVSPDALRRAVTQAADCLARRQAEDGHWCGELEGDSILESEYVLLAAWLGRASTGLARRVARSLLDQQQLHGGWSQFPGGAIDVSASVKAYLALKLTGHDADAPAMRRAREAIRAAGGPQGVNSFTRFFLALLGQMEYRHCPAVPPEMVLLPRWSPLSIYRISAWSRTIFVPLSIVWTFRPVRAVPLESGIGELFVQPPDQWPALRSPGRDDDRVSPWETIFRFLDTAFKFAERGRLRPLRRRALQTAQAWIQTRCAESDGLGAIFPSIVWSAIALRCLGYAENSSEVQSCLTQLEQFMIEDPDGPLSEPDSRPVWIQPCQSPVWDTALSLRALAATPEPAAERLGAAVDWLLGREVRTPGDWAATVDAEPGGWCFEYRNPWYPDVDDTAMVLMALGASRSVIGGQSTDRRFAIEAACGRGAQWLAALQNRDGGWGAFDRNNDCAILCHVPCADHNAMIDPSTPDITARVLEALGALGRSPADAGVKRALKYLRRSQESDGSWFGRWGVNYIYGTWQVLAGMIGVGVPAQDPAVQRGARWLLRHQQPGGGWGESPASYADLQARGRGPVTASQTAWALLGLHAAGHRHDTAFARGAEYLLESQQSDGSWTETEFTGTGFPRVFYLRYHLYPLYFPLLALTAARHTSSHPRLTDE